VRVKPFRGDQVAAGAVVLAVLVAVLNSRFDGRWSDGVHAAYTLAAAGFCAALGFPVRRPAGQRGPRAWETTLLVVCWGLTAVALARFVQLAEDGAGPGTGTLVALGLGTLGLGIALRGAGTGSFLAAVSYGVALLAFADWVDDPSLRAFRWLLLLELVVFVFLVLGHRDRRPHHAAQLANAAALAALGIVVTGLALPFFAFGDAGEASTMGEGWSLVLLAAGFGAIGFGAIDRHRGPVVLGGLVLLGFVLTEQEGDLLGWPLLLAVAAAALLVIALRPTHELPPPPDEQGEPVVPLPLR
jgi:hypothetical protein